LLGTDQNNELGNSLDLLVITEAARFPFESWKYLRGNVERAHGRIILISTVYFGSEFNQLMDGEHEESMLWNTFIYPANEITESDGSKVYDDKRLEKIKKEFGIDDYEQEFMCNTKMANGNSILARSLRLNEPMKVEFRGSQKKLYYSFDLGQSDETVLFVWYEDEILRKPVLVDYKIQNETNLEDFVGKMMEYWYRFNDSNLPVHVILPFDSNYDIQGYSAKLNRKKEMEKNIPRTWQIHIVNQMKQTRMLQVVRRLFETQKISIIDDACGNYIRKTLVSITKKIDRLSGKVVSDVDKKSGLHGDHPFDSVKYFCAFRFKDMFNDDYDSDIIRSIVNGDRLEKMAKFDRIVGRTN
jgi:hypothetical protein